MSAVRVCPSAPLLLCESGFGRDMQILIIRHAIAEERDATRWPDDSVRPLTKRGMRRFRKSAAGMGTVVRRVDHLLVSPFMRAVQTGEILHEVNEWPAPQRVGALVYGSPASIVEALQQFPRDSVVALVSHEPTVSDLVSILSGGGLYRFRKGACALIDTGRSAPAPHGGELAWLIQPRLSRLLGDQGIGRRGIGRS